MSGHPSSTILLPSELYSHIFSLIPSTQELRSLSQTSSIFYREALPFLYHTVDLTTTIARITAFSSALASNPTLGLHVRDLTIKCWYDPSDGDVRIDCEVLYHTILLATDNLRSLTILDTDLEFHDFEGMVSDCRFRLDAFHNLGEDLGVVYSFLIHQPTITHWSQCRPTRPRVAIIHLIHDQMLPNLTILNADINLPLVINKRNTVEELSLHYQWARGRQTFEIQIGLVW
ncbi:hypothetical protein JAAARDRAFT_421780 [Jaapia argillacea MUCL 33604]|uniref:F-box domain-containing protein n=1 Tax=Jaapia argillacea MUCL 33604 TaxID=933084 RepID=A0A067PG06_9AGAM|nr:hypothetical protein JAAARDRAFT_421780 [Jaapia argillacea MUCL 33604]